MENGSVSKGIEKSNIVDNNNNLKKFRNVLPDYANVLVGGAVRDKALRDLKL